MDQQHLEYRILSSMAVNAVIRHIYIPIGEYVQKYTCVLFIYIYMCVYVYIHKHMYQLRNEKCFLKVTEIQKHGTFVPQSEIYCIFAKCNWLSSAPPSSKLEA